MFQHRRLLYIFIIFSFTIGSYAFRDDNISAQTANQKSDLRNRLQSIRDEIKKYRDQLEQQSKKEGSLLDQLNQAEREIDLLQNLIRQLRQQETRLKQSILETNTRVLRLLEEFKTQKAVYADRLVHFYKHRKLGDLEILLSSKSINQVLIWLKYSRRIAHTDQRRLENLLQTKNEIEQVVEKRRQELGELENLMAEKTREEKKINSRRKEREKVLAQVRHDKKLLQQKIDEYKQAALEIDRLIRESERNRNRSPVNLNRPTEFTGLKGKMIWPTGGKVIQKYGRVKNPDYNIYYLNEGIDIQTDLGDEVNATCSGVITAITWQRSRGNIVIINHFGGYYTVYTHLSDILVTIGQEVNTGQLIGHVGESGSLSGPVLHFEIWKETDTINPELWLKKSS